MAEAIEFDVLRAHDGDKRYEAGDTRTAVRSDVAHLIGKVLVEKKPAAKPAKAK